MLGHSRLQSVNDILRPVVLRTRMVLGALIMPKVQDISVGIQMEGPFRGIFGITSEGGQLISVGIFLPKFAVLFLTNRFFAPIREFGKRN